METNHQESELEKEVTVNESEPLNTEESVTTEQDETEKLRKEMKEKDDKYLYLLAEFDNFKRRVSKDKLEWMQTAGKDVIISLLEVLDDCDRAEKQIRSQEITQLQEGTLLVFSKLRNILSQKGLKPMESIHTEFDVEKHEAITEIPVSEDLKGKVIDDLEKGYYLNEKLIRFAKVVVGK
jgi:molecular chaperone GrpE